MRKYCSNHRNNSHTTNECTNLNRFVKREDEGVSKVGYHRFDDKRDERMDKDKYERREKPTQQDNKQQDHQDNKSSLRGIIYTISRGFVVGGSSSSTRKKHLRVVQSMHAISRGYKMRMPSITFPNFDFQGVNPDHDDPIVIVIEMNNISVKKYID